MRILLITALILLTACNTPGQKFRGIEPVRISVGKSTFDVRVDGTRAEIIRLNPEWAPRLAAVAPRMVAAIEAVSGCKVRKLKGDQAVATASLDCGGPLAPLPKSRAYDCELDDLQDGYADLRCDPVD
jgi:hypothetical protein